MHFGRSGNNAGANQDNLDFLDWAIDRALSWGADIAIFGGDWHDQRRQVHSATLHASRLGMHKLSAAFKRIYWLPGNHDLFFRDKRDIASIAFAADLPHIQVVNDPVTVGDVSLLPWLIGDERSLVPNLRSRYVFGHLELPGFTMNQRRVMPDAPHLLRADAFGSRHDMVFSGHYHKRQAEGRIVYTGNTMPFDFSDEGDADRGIMLLRWGGEPRFEAWPEQPLYRAAPLSAVLADPGAWLRPKMTLRLLTDLDLGFEDAALVREALCREHGVRRLDLAPVRKAQEADDAVPGDTPFATVDQTVIDGILSIESAGIDPRRVAELYRSLADA